LQLPLIVGVPAEKGAKPEVYRLFTDFTFLQEARSLEAAGAGSAPPPQEPGFTERSAWIENLDVKERIRPFLKPEKADESAN
jgi:hypothetical protein